MQHVTLSLRFTRGHRERCSPSLLGRCLSLAGPEAPSPLGEVSVLSRISFTYDHVTILSFHVE